MSKLPYWALGIIVTLATFLLGIAGLWQATRLTDPLKSILQSLSAIVITSGIFSWWGAYQARVEVSKGLMRSIGISEDIRKSGLRGVGIWPVSVPRTCKKVDMVLIRGHAWVGLQATAIATVLSKPGVEVRICLVNPKSSVVPTLALKFGEEVDEVKNKIKASILEVTQAAQEAKKTAGGRLVLKTHNLIPTHSYYRFDEDAYVVWYSLRRGRIDVPMLSLGPGTLRDFFQDDFDRFWSEPDTRLVFDTAVSDECNRRAMEDLGIASTRLDTLFPTAS